MPAKIKKPKTDGLGPLERAKIRQALRQAWHRSHARRLCVKRCELTDGYSQCEQCRQRVPKVYIDHVYKVGEVGPDFISRLFCPSAGLQGLCKACHDSKTRLERQLARGFL